MALVSLWRYFAAIAFLNWAHTATTVYNLFVETVVPASHQEALRVANLEEQIDKQEAKIVQGRFHTSINASD